MVELGFDVIGLDVDEAKIDRLRAGEVPFFEPGLPELLDKHLDGGRLRFTTSYAEVAEFADVHFVCVGTPQRHGLARRRPDLRRGGVLLARPAPDPQGAGGRQVDGAGGHRGADGAAAAASSRPSPEVELAWNPEFLREGFAVRGHAAPGPAGVRRALASGPSSSCAPRSRR